VCWWLRMAMVLGSTARGVLVAQVGLGSRARGVLVAQAGYGTR